MDLFLHQLGHALQGTNLLILFLATVVGIIIGAIPGLTVNMAVALCVPLTIHFPLAPSLCMLFALYVSGIYGGSISAILVNTPGTPASAATTLDGFVMAQQGKAGKALKMALFASFCGGVISVLILVLVTHNLATIALKFGPVERSTLLLFALTIVGVLSGRSVIKGLLSGAFGLSAATVGADPMLAIPRFTFGRLELEEGFGYIPLLIGLFALSEIFHQAEDRMKTSIRSLRSVSAKERSDANLTRRDILLSWKSIIRSSLLGTFIGILPGIGATVACFVGYGEAKRAAKEPELFGQGTVEGVAASEAANNAVTGAALIPLLSLSIPGDSVTAILYGALLIQGVTVGPLIFQNQIEAVYLIYITLGMANIAMFIVGYSFMPFFSRVTEIPRNILFPIIFIFCVIGSYSIHNSTFDAFVMLAFGIIGYILRRLEISVVPMLIAFILAQPFEEALRQALVGSEGDVSVFLSSPIAVGFLLLTIFSVGFSLRRRVKQENKS